MNWKRAISIIGTMVVIAGFLYGVYLLNDWIWPADMSFGEKMQRMDDIQYWYTYLMLSVLVILGVGLVGSFVIFLYEFVTGENK